MSTVQIISLVILIGGITAFYALGIWGIKRMNSCNNQPKRYEREQYAPSQPLTHTQSLINRIHRVRIKANLKLRKQLGWHCRDIGSRCHGQQHAFSAAIKG